LFIKYNVANSEPILVSVSLAFKNPEKEYPEKEQYLKTT